MSSLEAFCPAEAANNVTLQIGNLDSLPLPSRGSQEIHWLRGSLTGALLARDNRIAMQPTVTRQSGLRCQACTVHVLHVCSLQHTSMRAAVHITLLMFRDCCCEPRDSIVHMQIRLGLETPDAGQYQRRVGQMRLLAELYNYRLIDSK